MHKIACWVFVIMLNLEIKLGSTGIGIILTLPTHDYGKPFHLFIIPGDFLSVWYFLHTDFKYIVLQLYRKKKTSEFGAITKGI